MQARRDPQSQGRKLYPEDKVTLFKCLKAVTKLVPVQTVCDSSRHCVVIWTTQKHCDIVCTVLHVSVYLHFNSIDMKPCGKAAEIYFSTLC